MEKEKTDMTKIAKVGTFLAGATGTIALAPVIGTVALSAIIGVGAVALTYTALGVSVVKKDEEEKINIPSLLDDEDNPPSQDEINNSSSLKI